MQKAQCLHLVACLQIETLYLVILRDFENSNRVTDS